MEKNNGGGKMLKKLLSMLLLIGMLIGPAFAAGPLSTQFKKMTPGTAGLKSAEIVYDVVNTDMTHKIKGFMWCQTPDETFISSSYGAATGGAQYVSPMFEMDKGPTQETIELTLDSAKPGEYNAKCRIKYLPFKEEVEGDTVKISYLKTNGEYTASPNDSDYMELRLDKHFVIESAPVKSTGFTIGGIKINPEDPTIWIFGAIGVLAMAIAFLAGRATRL